MVGLLAVVGGDEEDDFLRLIDLKEELSLADAVAPSGGLPVLQALDMGAKIAVLAQGEVDIFAKLGFEADPNGGAETREILSELARFEDSGGACQGLAVEGVSVCGAASAVTPRLRNITEILLALVA